MVIKRIVDACMTVLLLCLTAYQVTGEVLHEWIGMGMTALGIIHQILNRKWYGAIFKGKYNPYRIATTVVNIALLLSFAMTAFCGMSMSGHAVPFLYGMTKVSFARRMHLSMSHWAFVLMGMHLGMHIPVMFAKLKLTDKVRMLLSVIFILAALIIGFVINMISGGISEEKFGGMEWNSSDIEVMISSPEEEGLREGRFSECKLYIQEYFDKYHSGKKRTKVIAKPDIKRWIIL